MKQWILLQRPNKKCGNQFNENKHFLNIGFWQTIMRFCVVLDIILRKLDLIHCWMSAMSLLLIISTFTITNHYTGNNDSIMLITAFDYYIVSVHNIYTEVNWHSSSLTVIFLFPFSCLFSWKSQLFSIIIWFSVCLFFILYLV